MSGVAVQPDHPAAPTDRTATSAEEATDLAKETAASACASRRPAEDPSVGSGTAPVWLLLAAPPWSAPARPSRTLLAELQRRHGTGIPMVRSALLDDLSADGLAALGVTEVPTWLVVTAIACAGRARAVTSRGDESQPEDDHEEGISAPTHPSSSPVTDVLHDVCGEPPAGTQWAITDRRVGARPKYEIDHDLWQPHLRHGETSTMSSRREAPE